MKLNDYFEKFGISAGDVPLALVALKGTLWATWFSTFVVCYRFRPLQALAKHRRVNNFIRRLETRNPARFNYWKDTYNQMSEKVAANQYFQRFSNRLGLRPKLVTMSFVEAFFIYKSTLPITIPLQFWMIVSIMRRKHKKQENSIESILEGSFGVYQNIDELVNVNMSEGIPTNPEDQTSSSDKSTSS